MASGPIGVPDALDDNGSPRAATFVTALFDLSAAARELAGLMRSELRPALQSTGSSKQAVLRQCGKKVRHCALLAEMAAAGGRTSNAVSRATLADNDAPSQSNAADQKTRQTGRMDADQ